MAKQVIGIGTNPNDGNGDPLRTAFTKVNSNFTELYNIAASPYVLPVASGNILGGVKIGNNISIFNGVISVASQVQPDWNATTGLGVILNKPNDNELKNGAFTVALDSQGVLNTPNNLRLTDQRQVESLNANVNNGGGGVGRVGWFTHPDPSFSDGANTRVWGLDTPGSVAIRVNDGLSQAGKYWLFGKDGNLVLPAGGDIRTSLGVSILDPEIRYIVTTVPLASTGAPGDVQGMWAFNQTHMYYCSLSYDPGFPLMNIWKRVAWSEDTWTA
jgi:hypothetical protein